MEELRKAIAKNITELRKKKKMTQLELAEKLNYSDKAVSKWERAEAMPDVIILKELADLFEVTVDYFLTLDHKEEIKQIPEKKKNKLFITLLAVSPAWILATIAFFIIWILSNYTKYYWLVYVFALPVSTIILIVFNSIWGNKRNNFYIISVLVWSILASIYLIFLQYNLWLLFILGIPAQIVIFIWSRIK